MKNDRLHALADGIFAIAMTLLILEIRVPEIHEATNLGLLNSLREEWPAFFSWILSFALLFTYWRAHNVLMGTFAKALNPTLSIINMFFLLTISMVPFSSLLLGKYHEYQVAIGVYALNTLLVGVFIWIMREYINKNPVLMSDNHGWTKRDHRNAYIRSLGPPLVGVFAFVISFWSTSAAYIMLVFMGVLNVFSRGFDPLFILLDKLGIANEK